MKNEGVIVSIYKKNRLPYGSTTFDTYQNIKELELYDNLIIMPQEIHRHDKTYQRWPDDGKQRSLNRPDSYIFFKNKADAVRLKLVQTNEEEEIEIYDWCIIPVRTETLQIFKGNNQDTYSYTTRLELNDNLVSALSYIIPEELEGDVAIITVNEWHLRSNMEPNYQGKKSNYKRFAETNQSVSIYTDYLAFTNPNDAMMIKLRS